MNSRSSLFVVTLLVCSCMLAVGNGLSFNLTDEKITISSIEVAWVVPKDVEIEQAEVYATREGGQVKVQGLQVPKNETSYELTDLLTDANYEVCLSVLYADGDGKEGLAKTECISTKTIALVRPDSVYVLFIVIAVLAILCILGCLCWYRDKRKLEKENEGDGSSGGEKDESPTENQKTPILQSYAPPAYDRPKSSIEDEDIPYITPPLSELEKERRARAGGASA